MACAGGKRFRGNAADATVEAIVTKADVRPAAQADDRRFRRNVTPVTAESVRIRAEALSVGRSVRYAEPSLSGYSGACTTDRGFCAVEKQVGEVSFRAQIIHSGD